MRLSTCLLLSFIGEVCAVWPEPKSFTSGNSVLWIQPSVHVIYNNGNVWWNPLSDDFLNSQAEQVVILQSSHFPFRTRRSGFSGQDIVHQGVGRALNTLFKQNLVPWKLVARNQLVKFEPAANSQRTYINTLTISQTGSDNSSSFKPLDGQVDESYSLSISTDGKADISAASAAGVLHALETFVQLFFQHSSGSGAYTNLAPVSIQDAPKFEHRGLNFDISRNWFPVPDILRTIDGLAMNKFNRLHLHMTDGQSWPLDIPSMPELSREGAYQVGLSYSPSDLQNIQTYAIYRGIEVIIEFDMPGHTTSIALSHPDLIAAANAEPWDTYCNEPPCGSLKLNEPAVDDFLEKLFDDVLPRVSPYSTYFHTGGDEVNANAYLLDDTVKSNDTSVIGPLIQKLVDRNHAQVRAAGLTPIVWEEMLLQWNVTLGDDVVVQAWQSDENVAAITAKGHKALGGNFNYWYLDCGKGQWLNFHNGASFDKYYPFPDYCSPTKNWRLVYSYDPLAGVPQDQAHLVQGAEVHIWSEQTDPVNLDDMLWPRAGAAAEVLWSGRQDANGQNRSQIAAAPRLAEQRERMVNRGLRAGPVQMVFCTQHNSSVCAL